MIRKHAGRGGPARTRGGGTGGPSSLGAAQARQGVARLGWGPDVLRQAQDGGAGAQPPWIEKPLLRGVSHEIAAFVALAAWIGLCLAARSPRGRAAAAIYGAALLAQFTVSALYHRPTWAPRARLFWRRLDHSAIFLLIAGTYTPFCLLVGGTSGEALLAVVWGGAAMGVVQAVAWPTAPKPLVALIYVALGWVVIPVLPSLYHHLGPVFIALLAAGGITYSLGAAVYALRRPDPFPRVFGYHEVFHALVIAAAVLQFVVAARAVLEI